MGELGRARKQVHTWRIVPLEGEYGKWKLVKGETIMRGNESLLREDEDRPLPSMADLLATGFKMVSREASESGSSQRTNPPGTSNCVNSSCPNFPVGGDNNANAHLSIKNEARGYGGRVYASNRMQNCNKSFRRLPVRSRFQPPRKAENVSLYRKTSRNRVPFSSSVGGQQATANNYSKADGIQNFRPVENYGLVNARPPTEGGDDSRPVFQTTVDDSAGKPLPFLKRATNVAAEELSSEAFDPDKAGQRQINESETMFQTAAGNPMTVSLSSIKRAQAVFREDCTSEVLGSEGRPKIQKMQTAKATFQTAAVGPAPVLSSSSIKRARTFFCGNPASEVRESKFRSRTGTMNEVTTIFQTASGNPVTVSSSSMKRARVMFCEDPASVPDPNVHTEPQTMNQVASNFQTGANRGHFQTTPVTVSFSSTSKAQDIFREDHTSEIPESHVWPWQETMNKVMPMFQYAAENPVTVASSSIENERGILGEGPVSESVDHSLSMPQTGNNASTPLQTAEGNYLTVSSASLKGAQTIVKKDQDVGVLANCSLVCETSKKNNNFGLDKGNAQTLFTCQTASGQPVVISTSSMEVPQSILGEDGKWDFGKNTHSATPFQGAAVKPIEALPNCMERAQAILREDLLKVGDLVITEAEDRKQEDKCHLQFANKTQFQVGNGVSIMFQTGMGNPVVISSNSMKKACAILGEDPELKASRDSQCQSRSTTAHVQSATCGALPNMSMHNTNGSSDLSAGLSKSQALLESEHVQTLTSTKSSEDSFSMLSRWISGQSKCPPNKYPTTTVDCNRVHSPLLLHTESSEMHRFMFETVTGQSLNVSTTAMKRAVDLLGEETNSGATKVKSNNSSFDIQSLNDIKQSTVASVESPPLLFRTERGRSVSISNDAMKRAVNLLGELSGISNPVMDVQRVSGDFGDPSARHFFRMARPCNEAVSNKENIPYLGFASEAIASQPSAVPKKLSHVETKTSPKNSLSSNADGVVRSSLSMPLEVAEVGVGGDNSNSYPKTPLLCQTEMSHLQELVDYCHSGISEQPDISMNKDTGTRKQGKRKLCISPLSEISNKNLAYEFGNHCQRTGATSDIQKSISHSKSRSSLLRSISPFRQPRRSRFVPPYSVSLTCVPVQLGSPVQSFPQARPCEANLHTLYPSSKKRMTLQEYFGGPPHHQQALWHLSNEAQSMTADAAQHYRFLAMSASGDETFGSHDFRKLLLQCGANHLNATTEWVDNHYKWIVWKLACIERSYARQAGGKYLTVQKVLEELKYRYEREVNHGHRSPLKKITEGDAAAGSMMVLCVSAIRFWGSKEVELFQLEGPRGISKGGVNCIDTDMHKDSIVQMAKIEITDGWYCLNAILDEGLSKQLLAGKLFVGQKLRICGARLHGWVGPLPPLEAFRAVSLMLHINGTYRAHWAERLSFCRGLPVPLAFRCIKAGGGLVPRTFVGVKRIYPILYMERLADNRFIIRTERAEDKTSHLYNERRAHIVEDVVLKAEKENFHLPHASDKEKDEGAWLYSLLETAAEPELLMADMTAAQLSAFAAYCTKQEAVKQASIHKCIQKALEDADLCSRKVTHFMRIKVAGLTCKHLYKSNEISKQALKGRLEPEGLITIWQPTEKQILDLEEGATYRVSGLVPVAAKTSDHSIDNILQLHGNRSTTWHRISHSLSKNFEFLFSPRSALRLSNLGNVPLHSEFDVAAFIVHVGEPYTCGLRKRQWLFVSDGSVEIEGSNEQSEIILVIDISSSIDSFIPFVHSLEGSTVGFCNLLKKQRDQKNSLWVAELTENSIHSLNFNTASFCHLRAAADSVDKWAKGALMTVEKLQQRVSAIVGYSM